MAAVVSGVLFATRVIIDRTTGEPPSSASDLLAWTDGHQVSLAWADELAVFSAVLLIPVALALFARFDGLARPWVGMGFGLLAATVPLVLALMFAAILAILGFALRSDLGVLMATLSVVAAAGQIAASYPWLIGPDLLLACQLLVAIWLVILGLSLLREHRAAGLATAHE